MSLVCSTAFRRIRSGLRLTLLLLAAAAATAAADGEWSLSGEAWSAWQGYVSGTLDENAPAAGLNARAEHMTEGGALTSILLTWSDDLNARGASAAVSGLTGGERLRFSYDGWFERNEAGRLDEQLLFFDPDDLLGDSLADFDNDLVRLGGGFDWSALGWSLAADVAWSAFRYDEPGEYASDLDELEVDGRLSFYLPRDFQFDLETACGKTSHAQRPASDDDDLRVEGRLSRPLSAAWEASLMCRGARHSVRDATAIQHYEEPGGSGVAGGVALELHTDSNLFAALEFERGRETWDDYDGYYVDGVSTELNLYGSRHGADGSLVELYGELTTFRPGSETAENWSLAHGDETRLSGSATYRRGDAEGRSAGGGLTWEEQILGDDERDRFRYLNATAEVGWRFATAWRGDARVDVDRYESSYSGEETETEWGLGFEAGLEFRCAAWRARLHVERRTLFSILEEGGEIREGELGLRIFWNS